MSIEHAPKNTQALAHKIELPSADIAPFMTKREVIAYVGLSNRTMLDWEAEGRFPKRIVFSTRLVKWSRASIYAWVEQQLGSHEA